MFPVALRLFFISVCINGLHSSAEETVIQSGAANAGKDKTATADVKTLNDNSTSTEAPKTTTENTTTIPKPENEVSTQATVKEQNVTKSETTEPSEQKNKKTTRSTNDVTTDKSAVTTATTTKSNSEDKSVTEKVITVDDIVEGILDQSTLKFRIDEPTKNSKSISTTTSRPEPGYISKLTGSLIIPTLKARQSITKGFTKSNQGLRDIGSGTYEAASGAFNFVRDATSAIISG